MHKLTFVADKLGWVLLGLVVAFVTTILTVFLLCDTENCTANWLQTAVEFWGVVLAIVALVAARINATRRLDLRFHFIRQHTEPEEQVESLSESFTLNESRGVTLDVYLENNSPEPARSIRVEFELRFLVDVPKTLALNWTDIIYLSVQFRGLEEDIASKITGQYYAATGRDDVIIYGKDKDKFTLKVLNFLNKQCEKF